MLLVAGASVAELMVSGVPAVATVKPNVADFVWAGEPLSFTVTAKVKLPAEVGVPAMTPVGETESPPGNWPELIDHV